MEFLTAICQRPPVLLDKAASMAAALAAVAEAAERGARLITFPEAFLPGYPTWIWRLRPGADMALGNEIHRQLQLNAIDAASGDLDPLRDAAARHGMVIVMGMHELDSTYSGSTL
ncbi:MAG: nitrilase-related carbon-nitrogen hydrolase, partial [Aestuariivirga sp.]|nr:nitrilase-related carbon-nitrogen hydrolase [Aestuariivirga sp.]